MPLSHLNESLQTPVTLFQTDAAANDDETVAVKNVATKTKRGARVSRFDIRAVRERFTGAKSCGTR
jgi:predicted alpha/beta-hydrolase family hydrolase